MIAYQMTMTAILALGLISQFRMTRLQAQYGLSRKLLALFVVGILVSVGMIVWTWLLR